MSAASASPLIASLDLPAELRSLLHLQNDHTSIPYIALAHASLEAHFTTHTPAIPNSLLPQRYQNYPKPTINIDATLPTRTSHASFNILPYIHLHTFYPHIQFRMQTSPGRYNNMLHLFFDTHIHSKTDVWAGILRQGCVQQVRPYCRGKSVDIVLKPGSRWANEWQCNIEDQFECEAAWQVKESLGLTGKKSRSWVGYIVVGSVEG